MTETAGICVTLRANHRCGRNMGIDNIEKIQAIIAEKEGGNVEFKATTGQLDRGMETLCAFLNGTGGTVLFGVSDDGKIVGQEVSDKTKRDLVESIRRIEPLPQVDIKYVSVPERNKCVITVHADAQFKSRPFSYKGRAYHHMESVTSIMPQEHYFTLLLQRGGRYGWENIINENYRIEDLDEDKIRGAVRLGVENGRIPETTMVEAI